MKYLIVNADDFGAGRGINRGIHRGPPQRHRHEHQPDGEHAVQYGGGQVRGRNAPSERGLHVDLPKELNGSPEHTREELQTIQRFAELMGRPPTHLDSHHNVHREPQPLPCFVELAAEHGLPLREHSPVRYFSTFYGQWDGASHPEQIGVASLARCWRRNSATRHGLSCHPGFADSDFPRATRWNVKWNCKRCAIGHPPRAGGARDSTGELP